MRHQEYNYHILCEWCGEYFNSARLHTKFCSAGCRSKAHRASVKRSQKLERIKRDIDSLLMNCRLEVADMIARDIQAYAGAYTVRVIGSEK